jgi:hypothetical protein
MMCRENFIFHFSCSLGLKSLSSNRQGSTTKFEKLCVKFINKDMKRASDSIYERKKQLFDIKHTESYRTLFSGPKSQFLILH